MSDHRHLKKHRAELGAAVCLLAAGVLVSGCSAFFEFNLLKGLDKPAAPKASDYQGSGGLDKLSKDLSSPAIVAALAGDPSATAGIDAYLKSLYGTPQEQQAAVLDADLGLKTTAGEQFVNNVVTYALGGVGSNKTVAEILQSIVPPEAAANPAAFSSMVEGLLNACDAYIVFGGTVPPAPANVNMGDVAQKAAIAWMMRSVMNAVESSLSLTDSAADRSTAESQVFALLKNQPNSISIVTVSDPYASPPGWLTNIFTAAGTTLPS